MKFTNPVIRGLYPDPSVCKKDGKFYLVCSSFEYFPGVPLFESTDLVNWTQIANIIPSAEIVDCADCDESGGIFAVTIRFHAGKFFIITTAFTKRGLKNFFMTATDARGKWSAPIFLDIDGIDPSLFFDGGKTYVEYTSWGEIRQVEIDAETGKILKKPTIISHGCGGKYAEGPHIFRRGDFYYLLLAEGGTESGHHETILRSHSVWGPFEPSPHNPVISNVNKPHEILQCVGHADYIEDESGAGYLVCLGSRVKNHKPLLGRETLLSRAEWTADGWLKAIDGFAKNKDETIFEGEQKKRGAITLENAQDFPLEFVSPHGLQKNLARFSGGELAIRGNSHFIGEKETPALFLIRQREFDFSLSAEVRAESDGIEAGLVAMLDSEHYFSLCVKNGAISLVKRVDDLKCEEIFPISAMSAALFIEGNEKEYSFFAQIDGEKKLLGKSKCKHLSTFCADSANTGAMLGIYAGGTGESFFRHFVYRD